MPTPLKAFNIDLPHKVETEVISFMRDGIGMTHMFTAAVLREGLTDEMRRSGHSMQDFPEAWPRRIIDTIIKREKDAGNIEIFGANKGPQVKWYWIKK